MHSDIFVFLDDVQYKKREFQNRSKIRTKNGWIYLTVPVITKGRRFQKINEVEIDNTIPWRKDHLKSIILNYSHATYFKKYISIFEGVYQMSWRKLVDLNIYITKLIFEELEIEPQIFLSSALGSLGKGTQKLIDIVKRVNGSVYLSGIGGLNYLEESLFEENGITLAYQLFFHPVYKQVFPGFLPNMSIIDLLFNYGKESKKIIHV